ARQRAGHGQEPGSRPIAGALATRLKLRLAAGCRTERPRDARRRRPAGGSYLGAWAWLEVAPQVDHDVPALRELSLAEGHRHHPLAAYVPIPRRVEARREAGRHPRNWL